MILNHVVFPYLWYQSLPKLVLKCQPRLSVALELSSLLRCADQLTIWLATPTLLSQYVVEVMP